MESFESVSKTGSGYEEPDQLGNPPLDSEVDLIELQFDSLQSEWPFYDRSPSTEELNFEEEKAGQTEPAFLLEDFDALLSKPVNAGNCSYSDDLMHITRARNHFTAERSQEVQIYLARAIQGLLPMVSEAVIEALLEPLSVTTERNFMSTQDTENIPVSPQYSDSEARAMSEFLGPETGLAKDIERKELATEDQPVLVTPKPARLSGTFADMIPDLKDRIRFRLKQVPVHQNKLWEYEREDFVRWDTWQPKAILPEILTLHDFELCDVVDPSSFKLRSLGQSEALDELEQNMTEWYNVYFWHKYTEFCPGWDQLEEGIPKELDYLSVNIERGGCYAGYVEHLHRWVRVTTTEEVKVFGKVIVHLLDHGTQALLAHFMILPLRKPYIDLPVQAFAGRILVHKHGSQAVRLWTQEEKQRFRETAEGGKFQVIVLETESKGEPLSRLSVAILAQAGLPSIDMGYIRARGSRVTK